MSTMPDVPTVLAALVERLHGLDIAADIDPAQVSFPGVWVKWTGYTSPRTLTGEAFVTADLVVAVPANGLGQAIPDLGELVDELVEELGLPDGDARTQGTVFPASPVPMPSVVLPYLIAP